MEPYGPLRAGNTPEAVPRDEAPDWGSQRGQRCETRRRETSKGGQFRPEGSAHLLHPRGIGKSSEYRRGPNFGQVTPSPAQSIRSAVGSSSSPRAANQGEIHDSTSPRYGGRLSEGFGEAA